MPLDLPAVMAVRARRALVRPPARRALAVVVGLATALTVTWQARAADAARQRWSDTRPVVVARRDLEPGDLVSAHDISRRELPAAAVADTALATAPVGVVVRYPISAGEPLVSDRLGRQGLTGVAALLPEGHRAVTIAVGPMGVPPLQVGDAVDVVAVLPTEADLHGHGSALDDTVDTEANAEEGSEEAEGAGPSDERSGSATPPAVSLVDRALVVDVSDEAVTVAVPVSAAPAVAYAAVQGVAVLLLAGG